jgi:eukaryotic-like serine/threonine-protein kinase
MSTTGKKGNCWQHMRCGREPGGPRASELGTCPAAADPSFDGINEGINAGRFCWAVAGTFCGGKVQGSFADKRRSCVNCDFFKKVRLEEGTLNLHTKFLGFIKDRSNSPFFENRSFEYIKSGERFITQGKVGDTAYIIERGSCLVIVEKDGELHPVYHYGEGDIVGGMGILTGEPHLAHVEAETDMEVWALKKADFDSISERDPEVLDFLTEFVANRFDSRRPIAYRRIGKFIATDIIGRGAFSIVYKGVHATLNMPVAIKMMRHNLAMHNDFLVSFQNEAKTIASLKHENIVDIYDIEDRYRTLFIIMELLEGQRLVEMLKRLKVIPLPLAVDILLQTCRGLEYAHQQGVIHRDVTPENLFLLPGDRVKIIDFGIACPIGTEDFNLMGTAAYMSPEQIQGDPVDPRTDIYSLGIVAYEIVTGEKPFRAQDTKAVLDMHLSRDIDDPQELRPDLPEEIRRFIMNCGARDPDRRYQRVGQAIEDLQTLADKTGVSRKSKPRQREKMTNLFLIYKEEQQIALSQLMEEFSSKARELGVVLKASDLYEI